MKLMKILSKDLLKVVEFQKTLMIQKMIEDNCIFDDNLLNDVDVEVVENSNNDDEKYPKEANNKNK